MKKRKIIISLILIIWFFVGMDIIYNKIHENDIKQIKFKYYIDDNFVGYAYDCFNDNEIKICRFEIKNKEYNIIVTDYKGIKVK